MKNKEIYEKDVGKKIILYLLQDFQTQTSLTKLIFPKYTQQKVHPAIEYYFAKLKNLWGPPKQINSVPTVRKGNVVPYKKIIKVDRMNLTKFIQQFTNYNFLERTIYILETLCYPREIRKSIFNEKYFQKNNNDPALMFKSWIIHEFILEFVSQLTSKKSKEEKQNNRTSVIDFDKHLKNMKSSEDLSRDIFLVTAEGYGILGYPGYVGRFYDEEFFFDLIEGFEDALLLKALKSLFGEQVMFLEHMIEKSKVLSKIPKKKSEESIEYMMGEGVDDNSETRSPEEWEEELKITNRIIKIIEKMIKDLEGEFYGPLITSSSFIPPAEQLDGEGKLIIPKI